MLVKELKLLAPISEERLRQELEQYDPYNVWVDKTGWFCALSTPDGIVFYLASLNYDRVKILTPDEADKKMLILIQQIERVRRKLPYIAAKVYTIHSQRLSKLHKFLFFPRPKPF